jgi:putative flippase GtrA
MPDVQITNSVPSRWLGGLTRHVPPGQFLRYLAVGLWNTLFGYGTFVAFTAALARVIPHSYMAGLIASSLLNITVAYLGYKWFVFKTKGNYLREWGRCVMVYSSGILLSVMVLPVLVYLIRHETRFVSKAPYIAGALVTGLSLIYNFLGHKKFSFRQE